MRRAAVACGLAATVAVATVLPLVAATPAQANVQAQASVLGLDFTITGYDWTPRTGNVTVTARAKCPKRMWRADFAIELEQRNSKASGRKKLTCDGTMHTARLTLDPKRGRFHPGAATMQLTTMECVSDMCLGLMYRDREVRIPPPGHSHRGAR